MLINKYLKKHLKSFLYLFLLIEILIIFISLSKSSYLSYFWPDHTYVNYLHNLNLGKDIFEVLSASHNFNGITLSIYNPYLNPLSFLNYNLTSLFDYKLYLIFFRLCELTIIILHINYFIKKISIKEIVGIFFIYIIYLGNTTGFDHLSYINFPIIVFCFFHGLSLYFQKNNFLFFVLLLIGNIWSFLIAPIYFIVTCFAPLLFYYAYFLYKKDYKKIFLIFLSNLIVAVPFVMITLGTARINMTEVYPGAFPHYNFMIFQSKTFFILSVVSTILAVKLIYQKKEYFFSYLFLIINFLTITFGLLYKYKHASWKLPQPEYLDYAFQNIYILIIFMIIYFSKKDFFTYALLAIFFLNFSYKSYGYSSAFIKNMDLPKIIFANKNKSYLKKFFWDKADKEYLFKEDLQNKRVLINLPNFNSDLMKFSFAEASTEQTQWESTKYYYNKDFGGNLSFIDFWRNNIMTNEGHSQYLDISSARASLENLNFKMTKNSKWKTFDKMHLNQDKLIERQSILPISSESPLVDFYQVDYILSDVRLDRELYKKYDFDKYSIYLYRVPSSKKNYTIEKINYFTDFDSYQDNLAKINNELFLHENQKDINIDIKKFCDVKTVKNKLNKTIFDVNTNNQDCVAVFPTTYSHNNNFLIVDKNNNKKIECDNFRVQYFFHGCLIKENSKIELMKNNILLYPFGSFKDFLDLKKLNIH